MRRIDCQSDIVARSRRYPLSRDEQGQLEEHLAACAACRMALTVGADFDAIGGVRPGDGAFILGIADQLVRRRRARLGGLHAGARKVAVAAAAVFALLGAAAGAYALIDRHVPPPSPPAEAILQRASSASPDEVEVVAKAGPRESRVEAPEETADTPRQKRHARVAFHAAAAPEAAPTDDAALLFMHANAERRVGHSPEAIALYDELEGRYPDAQEAHAARVSLGKLLLASGQPGDALRQLDAYLSASPDGTLAPEALVGDAQALQQLGRKDDERGAWQRLVEKFPYSVYTAQARRRLQDLR